MNLSGIREGDVVKLRDDPSLWLVHQKVPNVKGRPGTLALRMPRSGASCTAKAGQVETHWRKRGRTR